MANKGLFDWQRRMDNGALAGRYRRSADWSLLQSDWHFKKPTTSAVLLRKQSFIPWTERCVHQHSMFTDDRIRCLTQRLCPLTPMVAEYWICRWRTPNVLWPPPFCFLPGDSWYGCGDDRYSSPECRAASCKLVLLAAAVFLRYGLVAGSMLAIWR